MTKEKLNVISYRIKQFADNKIMACYNKRNEIVERIIKIVELHQKAKKLCKMIATSFTISYLIMIVIGTSSFAISLYRLLNAISYTHDTDEFLLATGYFIGYEFCFLTLSFIGQVTINHADELFNAPYMSFWYKAPITIQKSLLFIMQISSKKIVINIGGIFVVTMETFTSITSTSMSFVAVIHSVQ
ncbi:uncharacterized protein LOC120358395 isoform X2 [Solenopsis invicta]|uniref:uncharacterized protein LOC120358395 isoform X2 n=1 Tax=Solenopsis invicta TaxID=13686 RepID=UPI00193CB512|nr:uncharacterized protein LOC120358395 isoform X2 [Solenopsis invicta]